MGLRVMEDHSRDQVTFDWEKISAIYEPDTKDLPEADRQYYESRLRHLMGRLIRLSNIKPQHLLFYVENADWIFLIHLYPMLFYEEYYRKEIGVYLNLLGLPLSVDALGFKWGPMSHERQELKQEVIHPELEEVKK